MLTETKQQHTETIESGRNTVDIIPSNRLTLFRKIHTNENNIIRIVRYSPCKTKSIIKPSRFGLGRTLEPEISWQHTNSLHFNTNQIEMNNFRTICRHGIHTLPLSVCLLRLRFLYSTRCRLVSVCFVNYDDRIQSYNLCKQILHLLHFQFGADVAVSTQPNPIIWLQLERLFAWVCVCVWVCLSVCTKCIMSHGAVNLNEI